MKEKKSASTKKKAYKKPADRKAAPRKKAPSKNKGIKITINANTNGTVKPTPSCISSVMKWIKSLIK